MNFKILSIETDVGTPEAPKRYTWNETTKAWDLVKE